MSLPGYKSGHKINTSKETFHGISPTADIDAEAASEAAFDRLEQSERLGRLTIHGALHADDSNVIDMPACLTETEPPQTSTDHQITA